MGSGVSVASKIKDTNQIIQKIHSVSMELHENYSTKFLDPGFCTRIALVYTDRLNNFKKHELNGVAYQLGLAADVPQLKENICESIVKHYTDRLNLIAAIQHSLSFCSNRIFALTSGPRCENNPEVFDQVACTKGGGRWVNYVVPPNEKIDTNKQWYSHLTMMQDHYITVLSRLLSILEQLKKYDESINDERLKQMGQEVSLLIDSMHKQCGQLYKLALVTPTYTEGELQAISEQNQIASQEQTARKAALRLSKGLQPIPPK